MARRGWGAAGTGAGVVGKSRQLGGVSKVGWGGGGGEGPDRVASGVRGGKSGRGLHSSHSVWWQLLVCVVAGGW